MSGLNDIVGDTRAGVSRTKNLLVSEFFRLTRWMLFIVLCKVAFPAHVSVSVTLPSFLLPKILTADRNRISYGQLRHFLHDPNMQCLRRLVVG